MAHHKSAKKRIRSNARKNNRNRTYISSVRTAVKAFRSAAEAGQEESKVLQLFRSAQAMLASAATKGVIHRNNASRKIGRLANMLKAVQAGEKVGAAAVAKKAAPKKAPTKKDAAAKTTTTAAKKKPAAAKKTTTKKK